ncbi:MAG: aldehyde dehydrogenase family protein, partial [Polaromonas sp.]|uniref:aldehyde dehydrogenase family protein n=1 Tax=Polaromonas sp. TaxID=1869339 RepID=UPI00272F4A17
MTIQKHDNLINGQWIAGAKYAPNINPSNVADVIGDYTQADAAQLDAAVKAARAAFPAWSTGNIQAR